MGTARIAAVIAAAAWALVGSAGAAIAAPGDPVSQVDLPGTGGGRGLTFDGHLLYYTNPGVPALLSVTPTGVPGPSIPVLGAPPDAISYDATRDMFWGVVEGPVERQVVLIDRNGFEQPQPQIQLEQMDLPENGACDNGVPEPPGAPGFCDPLIAGLAYDSNPDSLWVVPDGSNRIYHFGTDGTLLGWYDVNQPGEDETPHCGFNYASGVAVATHATTANGGQTSIMYDFAGDCRTWFRYQGDDDNTPHKLDWYPTYNGPHTENATCDDVTFTTNVVWVRDAFEFAHAFAAPTCILGGGTKILDKSRMTGGGGLPVVYPLGVSEAHHGFMIHCDQTVQPDRLNVTWGNSNHFQLTRLTDVHCTNPNPLAASFDTISGTGEGRYNGQNGFLVKFSFQDNGEPGTTDTGDITVTDQTGTVVMHATGMLTTGPLLGEGNYQAHVGQ